MTEGTLFAVFLAFFGSWHWVHAANNANRRMPRLDSDSLSVRSQERTSHLGCRICGIFPLVAFVAFPSGRAAGSEMAPWQVTARSDESDGSGAVRFRQLQAQGPEGQTAEIWVAFGLIGQVRCQVIAQSIHSFDSLRAAVEQSGSVAGVNGGYFKADGSPVGLLVCEGRRLHPFEKARLLSGVFLIRAGRPYIQRATGMPPGPLDGAIQCGPMLVEHGATVAGLNDERVAPRTFVFLTGRGKVGIGIIRSATLAQAARLLVSPALVYDERISTALNLDGGSSTGFFGQTRDGSLDRPEWARVADCLVFRPKTTDFH
jgi:hypothetical protein